MAVNGDFNLSNSETTELQEDTLSQSEPTVSPPDTELLELAPHAKGQLCLYISSVYAHIMLTP